MLVVERVSTTVANEFGSDMLRRFGGLQSLLSPPAHVYYFILLFLLEGKILGDRNLQSKI